MRRQDWSLFVSIGVFTAAVMQLVRRHPKPAVALFAVAVAADAVGRRWSSEKPAPMPASLRWVLRVPHPLGPLRAALEPRPGERVLEIGPGLGQEAVAVAEWVGPSGRVDVIDIQQEMLDATEARARKAGLANVHGVLADPDGSLPPDDESDDAAYLSSVLGELPDRPAMLREIRRVLKPGGRVIVAEVSIDPDFVSADRLRDEARRAGLRWDRQLGGRFAYHARLTQT